MKAVFRCGRRGRFAVIFTSFYLSLSIACAQTAFQSVRHFNISDGLLNNRVTAIEHDDSGYFWIGSKQGLQRFNGRHFSGLVLEASIEDLMIDKEGTLWVIADGKIYVHGASNNRFEILPHYIANGSTNQPFRLMEDWRGNVFVTFTDGRIQRFSTVEKEFLEVTNLDAKLPLSVLQLAQDKESGEYWLAGERDLFFYSRLKFAYTKIDIEDLIKIDIDDDSVVSIHSIHINRENVLWVSIETVRNSYTLKRKLSHDSWTIIQNNRSTFPLSFYTSADGRVWSFANSIAFFDNNRWNKVNFFSQSEFQLPGATDAILDISEGRDGSIWLATDNGVFAFSPQYETFRYVSLFSKESTDPRRWADHLLNLSDSLLFVFCKGELTVLAEDFADVSQSFRWLGCFSPETIGSPTHDGNIWLGENRQLSYINLKKKSVTTYQISESENFRISAITSFDCEDEVWIGLESGLVTKWKPSLNRLAVVADLRNRNHASAIKEILKRPDDPAIYVRSARNVFSVSTEEKIEFIPLRRDLLISDIEIDDDGLLLGTSRGLYLYDIRSQKTDSVKSLSNLDILTITRDRQHYLWITTSGNGLYRLSPSKDELIRYGKSEGIVYSNFSPAVTTNFGEHVISATTKGLLVSNPSRTPSASFNPRLTIVSFRVNDIDFMHHLDNDQIRLEWNENSISFAFSSMSFFSSDKLKFTYRLEGQSDSWETARDGENIRYSKLPPGKYTFRVRCRPDLSNAISDEVSVNFEIAQPFWNTNLFRFVILISFVVIVHVSLKRRERRRLRIQQVKNKISRDLHDHIGSSLSSINIMLQVAQSSMKAQPEQSAHLLKKISSTTHLAQENLHDIVWNINTGNDSMAHIVDRMKEFMVSIFEGQDVKTTFVVEDGFDNLKLGLEQRYDLYLLFKELVNNGAKYSSAKNVSVSIGYTKDQVILFYADDGVGFYVDGPESGNGIRNMKDRAIALGGHIKFESIINEGTKATLSFRHSP